MSNVTSQFCHKVLAPEAPPLVQNGKLVFQAYHIGWIISGLLTVVAVATSFWLISQHLQWYTNKREQRYLVRLLFMVPLYAVISFGSFLFWNHATPIILVRDAYEAIVLTAFFYLLLMYLSHDPEEQRRIFLKRGMSVEADAIALRNGEKVMQWCFPLGFVKWKPKDGLYFLQLMKWGILQYCVIRPTSTLAAVILDYMGLYCESSWGLGWGHIYITIIMSISVSIAMYCLIQLYMTVSHELAPHKPLLKLFSVKAVVFLTFWQATFLSLLSMFGVVHAVKYMTAEDVNIGIGAVLETFEMMVFAFLHIKAFSYKPYQQPQAKMDDVSFPSRTPQWRSLGHVMDFRETFREIWIGCIYMFDKAKGKEPTTDFGVIRETHFASAFGRQREFPGRKPQWSYDRSDRKPLTDDDPTFPSVEIEVDQEIEIEIGGQRQWLLLDRYDQRGLHPKREKSEGLQEQIDRELERLGYSIDEEDRQDGTPKVLHPGRQRSWWRNIYNRISQTGKDYEDTGTEQLEQRRLQRLRSTRRRGQIDTELRHMDIDDRPPQSKLISFAKDNPNGLSAHRNLDNNALFSPRGQSDHRSPLSDNDNRRDQHQYQGQETSSVVYPEMAGKRLGASRSPPLASHLPSPEPISPGDALPLTYGGPLSPNFPIRSPNDPVQENTFRQPDTSRGKRGSSNRPPRGSLVMPAPLDPLHPSNMYKWSSPPPTPPKDVQVQANHDNTGQTPPNLKRASIHRREAAAVPQDQMIRQTQSQPFPPSTRARYSGLPFESITDPNPIPQVQYFKQSRKPPPAF